MTAVPTRYVCGMTGIHHRREGHGRSSTRKHVRHTARLPSTPRRTTTRRAAATVEVSPCVFLDGDPYERLTNMAQQARANEAQFLERLILRAEAVWNFQPPRVPPFRPWWKLWGREPEVPAIVGDLRNVA